MPGPGDHAHPHGGSAWERAQRLTLATRWCRLVDPGAGVSVCVSRSPRPPSRRWSARSPRDIPEPTHDTPGSGSRTRPRVRRRRWNRARVPRSSRGRPLVSPFASFRGHTQLPARPDFALPSSREPSRAPLTPLGAEVRVAFPPSAAFGSQSASVTCTPGVMLTAPLARRGPRRFSGSPGRPPQHAARPCEGRVGLTRIAPYESREDRSS